MHSLCGIDEVGRGPLAGPVTAAAVILPRGFPIQDLADSKVLSNTARERIRRNLCLAGAGMGLGWAWPEEIDRYNIHNATLLAMRRAFESVRNNNDCCIDEVFVDGAFAPDLGVPTKAIVRGDSKVPEIMAASIVAKVARDRWMTRYGWIEPAYGFEKHKGYPTREHRLACLREGPSPIQRFSFRIRVD